MEQQIVDRTEPAESVQSEALQRLAKLEKFLANQSLIVQKMTEKMEIIESDNTKNTMRYNSFREDYKRLIEEQVGMRTASYKEEFISLDEIRPLKIAMKELEVRLRSKLDTVAFNEDVEKRNKEKEEFDAKIKAEFSRVHTEVDGHVQHLHKADTLAQTNIQELRQYLVEIIVRNQEEAERRWQIHQRKLAELANTDEATAVRLQEIAALIANNREACEQHAKLKQEQETRRFRDTDKKIAEVDKKLRAELWEREQKLSISLEALDARESNNHQALSREITPIRVRMAQLLDAAQAKKNEENEKLEMLQGTVDGVRIDFDEEKTKTEYELQTIKAAMEELRNQAEAVKQQIEETTSYLKQLQEGGRNIGKIDTRNGRKSVQGRDNESEASGTYSPINKNRADPSSSQVYVRGQRDSFGENHSGMVGPADVGDTIVHGEIQGGSLPVFGSNSPQASRKYDSISAYDIGNSPNLVAFRAKVAELESQVSILREMIDSKVNFSEIVKLQESKCSKISLREVVVKLETMKAILEKQLNVEGLKQLTFDEGTGNGAILSRLSMLRTRQHANRQDASRNGSKEHSKEKEKQPERKSIYNRLPNMLSHSRKRYLTLLDRSEAHTVQEFRPVNFP